MRAGGRSAGTIKLRTYWVGRVADVAGATGPWELQGDQLVEWAGAASWSLETRRSVRTSLRVFYAWAKATDRCATSPADDLVVVVSLPPQPRPAGLMAVRGALLASDDRVRLMVRLAVELGLRRGEVALVHKDDVIEDLTGWSLLVHGKGGRERTVPMPDDLAAAVMVATREGWAFPGRVEGHLSPDYVGKLVSAAMPDGQTMHMLRHRFATDAYADDTNLLVVQRLLGHASPATTQRYVATPDTAARATVIAAGRRWRGAA